MPQLLHTAFTKRQEVASFHKFVTQVGHALGALARATRINNQGTVTSTKQYLRATALLLRNSTHIQATTLTDVIGTDRLRSAKARFALVYQFLSDRFCKRTSVELHVAETNSVPSLATPFFRGERVFAAAAGMEREVGDLLGVFFTEHGDLRRILTDYGFSGHPLRKDFPLTGFNELVYDDVEGRITRSDVELSQEYRVFHLS